MSGSHPAPTPAEAPSRQALTDPEAFPWAVRAPGDEESTPRWRTSRAWPRRTGHLLLELHRADGTNGDLPHGIAGGQWFADATEAAELAASTPGAELHGHVVVQTGGVDGRLPRLRSMLDTPDARLLTHRPGRRAVLRVPAGDGVEYLKVVRRSRAADYARRAETAARLLEGTARVPTLLGIDDGVMRWADVGGRTLHDLGRAADWDAPRARSAWAHVGTAVERLHSAYERYGAADPVSGVPLARHTVAGELSAIDHWLDPAIELGLLDGAAAAEARALVGELLGGSLAEGDPWPADAALGVLHRDLHDKQVLMDGDDDLPAIIDVDTLAVGERALDVANVLAHLDLRHDQGLLSSDAARASRHGFLGEVSAVPADRLTAYLAATRLRLAAVYSFRPQWWEVARHLLERARSTEAGLTQPARDARISGSTQHG